MNDYDGLVTVLRGLVDEPNEEDWDFAARQAMGQAANAIEALQKPRWIPVGEALPETWEKVLTYGLSEIAIDCQSLGGGWVFGNHVTHWMPLPELPKEEK